VGVGGYREKNTIENPIQNIIRNRVIEIIIDNKKGNKK